jgi:hypothetical protein
LWVTFKTRFHLTSRDILEKEEVWLAEKLVQRIEKEGVLRRQGKKRHE